MEEEEIVELIFADLETPVEDSEWKENDVDGNLQFLEEEIRQKI